MTSDCRFGRRRVENRMPPCSHRGAKVGKAVSHTLSLRPVTPADDAFLFELYASTRPELAALGLGGAPLRALLQVQWMAQRHGYQSRYPHGEHQLVLVDGQP